MPRKKLSRKLLESCGVPPDSHAISGRLGDASARAASGHAAAAPARSVMSSRRPGKAVIRSLQPEEFQQTIAQSYRRPAVSIWIRWLNRSWAFSEKNCAPRCTSGRPDAIDTDAIIKCANQCRAENAACRSSERCRQADNLFF